MVFESPRLIIRLPEAEDFPYFFGAMSDPEIMRYIRAPIQAESAARERVNGWEKYAEKHPGLGVFVAVLKENGAFAGYCVARHVNFDSEQQEFEIGYTFLKDYWGLGLASELVPPLCHYCFTQTKAPYLVAFTDPENMASQRVLRKNGFELFGQRKVYEGISNEYRLNQVGYSA
ncbi:MAG: GNAT family N-acetyltransferase [Saprospiraceae bacterium]|nr:GNAT family N-acetyltransferase [Saprospiraceae bacterium]